jgi:hypothetical protein
MKRTRLSLSLLLACMLLAERLNNRYMAPLPSFQNSTSQAVSLIGDFYSSRTQTNFNFISQKYVGRFLTCGGAKFKIIQFHLVIQLFSPASNRGLALYP